MTTSASGSARPASRARGRRRTRRRGRELPDDRLVRLNVIETATRLRRERGQQITMESDRTAGAVAAQLKAMACERYEIGLRDVRRGVMILREWTAEEVTRPPAMRWLKRMNAHDHDVYIRPLGSVGLILTDDLTESKIAQMKSDGLSPALVVETSPANHQAWLRVSASPIPPELATAAARLIAERYGADMNSATRRHFGRLAGFTNRKPKHERDGRHPYVLVRASPGLLCERGAQLLQEAGERLRAATAPIEPVMPGGPRPTNAATPAEAYRAIAEPLMAHYGAAVDYSLLDWTVCKRLGLSDPAVDRDYLVAALEASPGIEARKRGHVAGYARLTAEKVLRDPAVIAARKDLAGLDM
jgi:RepB DNA-primase from phage plasmid